MIIKNDYQNQFAFVVIAIFLIIIWGLIGYYILGPVYFIMSFLFYPAIFLLGMLFKVRNCLFIPVTYLLVYGSDWISRYIIIEMAELQKPLFIFLVFYHIELIILSIIKTNLDAKYQTWDVERKRINKWVALILPVFSLCIYYIIIRQVFVFE